MMKKNDPNIKLTKFLEEEKGFLDDLKKVDTEKNWKRFLQSAVHEQSKPKNYTIGHKFRLFIRIAAAILFLIAVFTTIYFTASGPSHRITQAKAGPNQMELILSDGSAITLNKGAVLTYPEKLNRRSREVILSGEAYFQVERADKSPFYVNIRDMTVKVVGTSFNLREDPGGRIELGVAQGIVLFYETGGQGDTIRLTGGQKCVFDSVTGEFSTDSARSDNYLYWKTQKLTYRDEPLAAVFKELEVLFRQNIIISDPLILQNRWNSIHENQKLTEILDVICLYFDLEYFTKNDTVYIEKK